jgi:hypothetical protein
VSVKQRGNAMPMLPVTDMARGPCEKDVGEHVLVLVGINHSVPPRVEVSPWTTVGGGLRKGDGHAISSVGAGVDVTFGVAKLRTFPRFPSEMRLGPWVGVESPLDRVRAEGGVAWVIGSSDNRDYGVLGMRIGLGATSGGSGYAVGGISIGIRRVAGRTTTESICQGAPPPRPVLPAGGVRLFATMRSERDADRTVDVVFGVEFAPWILGGR